MEFVKTELTDSILFVTISRPQALNALNSSVLDRLNATTQEVLHSDSIRGMIITGEGDKAFVAGADIKELTALNKEEAFVLAQKGQMMFKQIENMPKPVIAAVNGFALGGGCELAMACHIRVAVEGAKFGQPEVNLGIIPGYGGTQRLTQLVGRGKALELILTGDLISAQEAKSIGLVNEVVANRDELMASATKMMKKMILKGPLAVAHAIKAINAGFSFEDDGYLTEAQSFAECTTTEDFKEGTTAFIEKRTAQFKGK